MIEISMLCKDVDEYHHNTYANSNKFASYNDMYMVMSGKFMFTRYNHDSYMDRKQKRIKTL